MGEVRLRQWKDSDRAAFAEMNSNPQVMEFLLKRLSREESDELFDRIKDHIDEKGWGLWAVDVDGELAGWTGLNVPGFESHFTPCVEIGWRLVPGFWGMGYATMAARQALQYGFEEVGLEEIVSFTALPNRRSMRVMERLGMTRVENDDFDHPMVPEGHWLCRHVLYRIRREEFVFPSAFVGEHQQANR